MQNVFQLLSKNKQQSIYLFFIFTLLTSCSHLKKTTNDSYILEAVKQVQLSGEGRGRVSVDSQRYLFDFGSLSEIKSDLSSWILELDFALHGSEHLIFKWEKKRWSVGGSFLGALRQFIRGSKKAQISERELNELLAFISESIRISLSSTDARNDFACLLSGVCPIPKREMVLNWTSEKGKSLSVSSKSLSSRQNMTYSLDFSNLKSNKFKLLSLKVKADQGYTKAKELLSLNLYFN